MASFAGHITSGIILVILGTWWLINVLRDYRRCLRTGETYVSRISYVSTIRNKRYPVESYMKVIFMAYFFLGELFRHDFKMNFVEEGHFVRVSNLQHMSIFGLFLIHGVTDVLCYYKISPIMKEMKYITGMIAFSWFGVQIYYYSTESTNKSPLENMLLRLPLPSIFILALMFLWEMRQRDTVTPQFIKCLVLLLTGSWYITLSFILFEPFSTHGGANPAWDRYDMRNVQFITALYGYHIIFNILVVITVYSLVATHEKLVRLIKRRILRIKGPKEPHVCSAPGVGVEIYRLLEDDDVGGESLKDETFFNCCQQK